MLDRHVRRSGSDYGDALVRLLPQGRAWPRNEDGILSQFVHGLANIFGLVDSRAADLLERETDPRITVEMLPDWERAFGLPDKCVAEPLSYGDRIKALLVRITMLGAQSREFFIALAAAIGYTITITEYRPFMVGMDRVGDNRVPPSTGVEGTWGYVAITQPTSAELVSITGTSSYGGSGGPVQLEIGDGSAASVSGFATGNYIAVNDVAGTIEANGNHYIDVITTTDTGRIVLRDTIYENAIATGDGTIGPAVPLGNQFAILGPPENRFYWTVHVMNARLTWFRVTQSEVGVDPHLRIGLATDLECILRRYKPAQTDIIFDYSGLATGGSMAGTP